LVSGTGTLMVLQVVLGTTAHFSSGTVLWTVSHLGLGTATQWGTVLQLGFETHLGTAMVRVTGTATLVHWVLVTAWHLVAAGVATGIAAAPRP